MPEQESRSPMPRERNSDARGILLFQVGPVQEFIACARTTRDLWAGSYLLSYSVAELICSIQREDPDVKFIFVSGYAEEAFSKNLPEGAQFGFLPKPFSLKQLATKVTEALEE